MTGKTHKLGGFVCSVVGFELLRRNGMLIDGVNEGLQWLAMYPFCYWGSVASDLDHNDQAIPMKDPPSIVFHKMLHLTAPLKKLLEKSGDNKSVAYKIASLFDASHRSWQTHSDLTLFVLLWLIHMILGGRFQLGAVDSLLLSLMLMGVTTGLVAHFILDMLTTEGVWSVLLVVLGFVVKKINPRCKNFPTKIKVVPRWHFFRTGASWELFVQKVLKILNVCATLYLIWTLLGLGNLIPFEITI